MTVLFLNCILAISGTFISSQQSDDFVRQIVAERYNGSDQDEVAQSIIVSSAIFQFDPILIMSIIEVESKWSPSAVSPTGAKGIMQVVSKTWNWMLDQKGWNGFDIFSPTNNILVAVAYLAHLRRRFRTTNSLLLAYNQGPRRASEILHNEREPTEEAKTYATKVNKIMSILRHKFSEVNP